MTVFPVLLYYRYKGEPALLREVVLSDECTARMRTLQPHCDHLQAQGTAVIVDGLVHHPIPEEFKHAPITARRIECLATVV